MREAMRKIEEQFHVDPLAYGPREDPEKRQKRILQWSFQQFVVPALEEHERWVAESGKSSIRFFSKAQPSIAPPIKEIQMSEKSL